MSSYPTDSRYNPMLNQYVNSLLVELHSVDSTRRDSIVRELQKQDWETVVSILRNLLNNPDSDVRADAAEAALRIDPYQSIDIVLPLLNESDSTMRWHICGLLHDFGDKRAARVLVKILLEDSDGDVRWMAAWALGEIGDDTALSALHQAAEDDDGTDHEGRRVCDVAAESIREILARGGQGNRRPV